MSSTPKTTPRRPSALERQLMPRLDREQADYVADRKRNNPGVRDVDGRCPKCRSRTFELFTFEEFEIGRSVVDGYYAEDESGTGQRDRVRAHGKCRCGHEWRFRKAWP